MDKECKPPVRTVQPAHGEQIGSATVKSPDGLVTVTSNTAGAHTVKSGTNPTVLLGVDGKTIMILDPNKPTKFESELIGLGIRAAVKSAFECGDFNPARMFGDDMPKTTTPKGGKAEDPLLKPKGRA